MSEYSLKEEEECMLHNDYKITTESQGSSKKCLKVTLVIIGVTLIGSIIAFKNVDNKYLELITYTNEINCLRPNLTLSKTDFEVEGFMPLNPDDINGPITTSRECDDGRKRNMYSKILKNNEEDFNDFYYNKQDFMNLPEILEKEDEYVCERNFPLENELKSLACPEHYTLAIDDARYGRYARDKERCKYDANNNEVSEKLLSVTISCTVSAKDKVKEMCEGRTNCSLISQRNHYSNRDPCVGIAKYLHVKYHCVKEKEIKKPKFAIVMYADNIAPNSVYEHAISEFYQYSKIHGYKLIVNNNKYDDVRRIFYMKLYVIQEALIEGLKNKKYDWIFWVDSDVALANPNIKLETFLPKDNNVNLVIAADHNGINAGVFLIRVCSWSLNYMSRSIAYQYNRPETNLGFADQTSMNDVLLEGHEQKHFVIVPQNWFNIYPGWRHDGDMLIHFAGRPDKNKDSLEVKDEIDRNENYLTAQTNKSLRKEVLEFYDLPREKQGVTFMDNDNTKEKQNRK
eukprot:jgi/Orpsp1_1/1189588/evm.model.d7180000073067.1